jgi:hypothetical protein
VSKQEDAKPFVPFDHVLVAGSVGEFREIVVTLPGLSRRVRGWRCRSCDTVIAAERREDIPAHPCLSYRDGAMATDD